MTVHYREAVAARIEALRAAPGFSVRTGEIRPPVSKSELAEVLASTRDHLPAGVEEFYTQLNGFTLEWDYTAPGESGEPSDFGSINILPLQRVFADWRGAVWFDDFEGGERFKAVKPFDLYIPEACAAFRQEPGAAPEDAVYFHYIGESLAPLLPTFADYIRLALVAGGYLNWRIALTPDNPGLPDARPTLERLRQIVPGFTDEEFAG